MECNFKVQRNGIVRKSQSTSERRTLEITLSFQNEETEDLPWISEDDLKGNHSSLCASPPAINKIETKNFKNLHKLSLRKKIAAAPDVVQTPTSGSRPADLIPAPHTHSLTHLLAWGFSRNYIINSLLYYFAPVYGLDSDSFYIPHVCISSPTSWLILARHGSSWTGALVFLWSCIPAGTY